MARRKQRRKRKQEEEEPELTLPDERSEPSSELGDYSLLIYGEKKIGKTSLAAQFPDAFFLMCEPGGKGLEIYQRPVNRWVEFLRYKRLLRRDREFRTVVVDTADRLYDMAFDYMCAKLAIEHPHDENDFGKSWRQIKMEFTRHVNDLLTLDKGVIFLSHTREEEVKTRGGRAYTRLQPSIAGQARDVLEAIVDIWCYYGYEGTDRTIWLQGDELVSAGHRLEDHFNYREGGAIRELNVQGSAEGAYTLFTRAFANDIPKPEQPEERPRKKKLRRKRKK